MALNSLAFIAFLALVLLVYYIVPKKFQWIVLLVASYGFYLTSGVKNVVFIDTSQFLSISQECLSV